MSMDAKKREIEKDLLTGLSLRRAAKKYNVSRFTVEAIAQGIPRAEMEPLKAKIRALMKD